MSETQGSTVIHYVGFLKRLLAYIIDGILTYLLIIAIKIFVPLDVITENIVYLVIWTGYWVWMTGTFGATVGKMVLKIKIVKEDGSNVGYLTAFVRELASYLSFLIFGLGFLNIIWDGKKQSWHDKIAKTLVVKV